MARWADGDPSGFLEISDPSVTYFDPFQQSRLNDLDALTRLYSELTGKIHIDRYEYQNAAVQENGGTAVLSYDFQSSGSEGQMCWHCTEVYRQTPAGWRIIHTHWSLPQATA